MKELDVYAISSLFKNNVEFLVLIRQLFYFGRINKICKMEHCQMLFASLDKIWSKSKYPKQGILIMELWHMLSEFASRKAQFFLSCDREYIYGENFFMFIIFY